MDGEVVVHVEGNATGLERASGEVEDWEMAEPVLRVFDKARTAPCADSGPEWHTAGLDTLLKHCSRGYGGNRVLEGAVLEQVEAKGMWAYHL